MSETEQWIRPGQGKVIALLHGIGAKCAQDYWHAFLQVLQTDEKLADFGLFVWEYPTSLEPSLYRNLFDSVGGGTLREAIPDIKVLGGVWNSTYQTQLAGYRDVILICHSMGGLVAKFWIIDTLEKGQSHHLDSVRHITFYATPHKGAPVTTLASWNNQLKNMQLDSPFIEDVGQRWYEHVVVWKEKQLDDSTRRFNRFLPHKVIAGAKDRVVPPRFASIVGMDTTLVIGDHSQVIQPQDASDTRYKAWRDDMQKALQDDMQRRFCYTLTYLIISQEQELEPCPTSIILQERICYFLPFDTKVIIGRDDSLPTPIRESDTKAPRDSGSPEEDSFRRRSHQKLGSRLPYPPLLIHYPPRISIPNSDTKASRTHCQIYWSAGGVEVINLQSKNKTFVNEEPVEQARLAHGDFLRCGRTIFRFDDRSVTETDDTNDSR